MSGPHRPWSLVGRLSRNVLATVAIGWLATIGLAIWSLNHEMNEMFDAEMQRVVTATALLMDAAEHGHGRDAIPRALGLTPENESQVLRLWPEGSAAPPAPWPMRLQDGFSDAPGWRVFRHSVDGTIFEIGLSDAWRHEEVAEAASAFVVLLLPLLVLVVLMARRSVTTAMRPAQTFAAQVAARRPEDLSPLAEADLPRELQPLAHGLNLYLARIEDLRLAERRFIGNAAHELRTPIAALRARLDLAGAAAPEGSLRLLDDLTRRIERLLQVSRSDSGLGLERGPSDLVQVTRLVIDEIRRRSPAPITFDDSDLDRLSVAADADALAILIRNLIDNAVDHGTGPVRVSLTPGGQLTVTNPTTGTGFAEDPFQKGPNSQGMGLGLAIVATLARAMQASIDKRIEAGLARVTVQFPL